jgi:DNA-binding NarL/FixJ family response regulator
MSGPLRILLADDHVLFRKGVRAVLASRPDLEVVGEANDGVEAIALARSTRPDVVLMDVAMPNCDGLNAARQIRHELPQTKIVILTVSEKDDDVFEALKCGAQGYLIKDLKARQLFDTLDSIARGEASFSGVIAAKILQEFRQPTPAPDPETETIDPLTDKDIRMLDLVVNGYSNKEIATTLALSESTVKNYLRAILEKLHLRNRTQAAVYAVCQGLVERPKFMP